MGCRSPYEIPIYARFNADTTVGNYVAVLLMRFIEKGERIVLEVIGCRSPYEILEKMRELYNTDKSCRSPYEIRTL